ncbi:hypothetical protein [Blastopirellula retiformator]|uniref:Uncharacterized protein n=1 Tax=Blastopirellula retiformator TaxID=2527970 RepID=A0A5C5V1Y2_9BACT|nr:hypothetical protein [Blastopirellula retiformator]TWT31973.1 hypothetical protein Enr8_38990 [Blastopirellula retiformator]
MNADIDPKKLTPKSPISEVAWRLWEKKNLNIHRGVVEWHVDQPFESVHDLATHIRTGVKTEFRPGWLRGFGFGTVLHFQSLSPDFAQICQHIDGRNKKNGVWQWAVLQFDDDKVAIGVHTWMHGYLHPVYESILARLEANGYQCKSTDAEVDKLIATLTKIHDYCSPVQLVARFIP